MSKLAPTPTLSIAAVRPVKVNNSAITILPKERDQYSLFVEGSRKDRVLILAFCFVLVLSSDSDIAQGGLWVWKGNISLVSHVA